MSFIDTIKAFFKAPKIDPATDAAFAAAAAFMATADAFVAAADAYHAASHAIDTYTIRANHRLEISNTRAPDPYTEDYLDAHTAAIDTLTSAFDDLSAAFANVNHDLSAAFADIVSCNDFYGSIAAMYKSICDSYSSDAEAYSWATNYASTDALKAGIRASKHILDLMCKRDTTRVTEAEAKAAAAKAEVFFAKAEAATAKAEVFVAKAKAATAKAEEALGTNQ
jgi:hypothetical protein